MPDSAEVSWVNKLFCCLRVQDVKKMRAVKKTKEQQWMISFFILVAS
jgi:hypothetical protein